MVVFHVEERNVPRILITERLAQEGIDLLRRELPEAVVDRRVGLAPAQLRAVIGGYTVLIVDSDTRVTDDLFAAAPRLRLIGRAGSGVDNIDLEAAGRRGVLVVHAPAGDVPALAEHSIAMLLALARHSVPANSTLKAGRWEHSHFVGVELSHKTLGILGLGKVGREVARLAQAFSMRVLGFDPAVAVGQAQRAGVRMLSKAEVLQQADFVMLHAAHLSGSSEAAMLIGARELRLLRPGAYLVSCAGGRLIDEAAMLAALDQGRLAGAALDVFREEPIVDGRVLRRLLVHERVIATPHLGALTREAQARVATEVARNVVSALRGDTLIGAILPSFPPMAPP
jgi:D-3-phosphoglycerate dehydrogenase / 2-oxoglutarate reductase